jgi:hypothetical protein
MHLGGSSGLLMSIDLYEVRPRKFLLSWFGTPCVLAIPPSPRLRRAQAREEEAET